MIGNRSATIATIQEWLNDLGYLRYHAIAGAYLSDVVLLLSDSNYLFKGRKTREINTISIWFW